MTAKIKLDTTNVEDLVNQNDWENVIDYFEKTFKVQRAIDGTPIRFEIDEESLEYICNLFHIILTTSEETKEKELVITEILRGFRNCISDSRTQSYFLNSESFFKNLSATVKTCLHDSRESVNLLKISLQFLINFVISNEEAVTKVYGLFHEDIMTCLRKQRCLYESSALLYNLYSKTTNLKISCDIYKIVLGLYEEYHANEYLHFLIEMFIEYDPFWKYYDNFDIKFRLIILEIIRDNQIKKSILKLSDYASNILISKFIDSSSIIFQTVEETPNDLRPYEVSILLDVIASLSSDENYLKILQKNKDLLINSGVLLLNVHRIGQRSDNYFSAVQKLSEIKEPTNVVKQHPAFGFKVHLVRLIGNLCWKDKQMQDLTRTAELIPIILDCCNIDARNPFIMQWVILAVRNLCENNIENQKFIASLHQEGVVNSTILEEVGLTVHADGENQIKLVSLESLRQNKRNI